MKKMQSTGVKVRDLLFLGFYIIVIVIVLSEFVTTTRSISWLNLNLGSLVLSILALFLGMLLFAFSWKVSLEDYDLKTPYRAAIISTGLTTFTKYLPGKLWILLGRAELIAIDCNHNRESAYLASFESQFASIWIGLTFGVVGLVFTSNLLNFANNSILIIGWVVGTFLVFLPLYKPLLTFVGRSFLKFKIENYSIGRVISYRVFLSYAVNWTFFSIGFYFLCTSFGGEIQNLAMGLAFPFAAALGIIAIFAPGGLGVREVFIVSFLMLVGMDFDLSKSIALFSRAWFMLGEFFIFLLAVALRKGLI